MTITAAQELSSLEAEQLHTHDFKYYLENGATIGQCRFCPYRKTVNPKRAPNNRMRRLHQDE